MLATLACASAVASADASGARLQAVNGEAHPDITLSVVLPAETFDPTGPIPGFTVTENGEKVRVADVSATARERDPLDAVLVMDVSGSMRGQPLKDAKDAARAFIEALAPGDQVAIISFAGDARLLTGFTDDHELAERAVNDLVAGGETGLYDAVDDAIELVAMRSAASRSIVLLADGADDSSGATLDSVAKSAADAGAPIYAVTLQSPDFDPMHVRSLVEASGGRAFSVADSGELADRFESIAEELQNIYEITFTSNEPATVELELDVTATSGDLTASLETAIGNPMFAGALGEGSGIVEEYRVAARTDPLMLLATVVAFFLAIVLLATSALLILAPGSNALRQLEFYDQLQDRPSQAAVGDTESMRARMTEAIGWVAGRRGITQVIRQKLEQAGLPLRPLEYMYVHIVAVIAVGFISQLLTGSLFTSVLMVFVAVMGPLMALEVAIDRRRRAFEEQLPEILSLIAGSIRAGWGLLQSLDLVVKETAPPASVEFRRVESEARLGLPLDQALEKMAERLGSEDFRWTVIAINIQREVGGNLAEILDILADTMRERAALKRHVRALTAEGRLSAIILYALPFFAVLTLSIVRPDYFAPVVGHPAGLGMIAVGLGLLAVGGVWLSRVVRVEV